MPSRRETGVAEAIVRGIERLSPCNIPCAATVRDDASEALFPTIAAFRMNFGSARSPNQANSLRQLKKIRDAEARTGAKASVLLTPAF